MIRRTNAGLEAARSRSRIGGRKKGLKVLNEKIAPLVLNACKEGNSIRNIMQAFSIPSTATVYKILNTKTDLQSESHSETGLQKGAD
ncbi:hypothetical protein [Dyadobacter arcticus]|uniref:DNA invertase Pin-like site-specific DNA recombinase n=1 Tax=Dyadobacter arcticus TaxID=1078754 RepID=A0ABX0UJT3_9BACT|nr:hypothetical protein [Dyadobacter arcticus]NIJ52284.1 DNA invertase Pin-like site-specific DNA recombinase [Dyadobacter arcticus]